MCDEGPRPEEMSFGESERPLFARPLPVPHGEELETGVRAD